MLLVDSPSPETPSKLLNESTTSVALAEVESKCVAEPGQLIREISVGTNSTSESDDQMLLGFDEMEAIQSIENSLKRKDTAETEAECSAAKKWKSLHEVMENITPALSIEGKQLREDAEKNSFLDDFYQFSFYFHAFRS